MSNTRVVKVVSVRGTCNAGFVVGDTFLLQELQLIPEGHHKECCIASASITANLGRLKLQPGPVCVSCPDPATGSGGNVIFEITWRDCHEDNLC